MAVTSLPEALEGWRKLPVISVSQEMATKAKEIYVLKGGISDVKVGQEQVSLPFAAAYPRFRDIVTFTVADEYASSSKFHFRLNRDKTYHDQSGEILATLLLPEVSRLECLVGISKRAEHYRINKHVNYLLVPGHFEVVLKNAKLAGYVKLTCLQPMKL